MSDPSELVFAQLYLAVDNKVCETGKIKLKFCCRRFMYFVEQLKYLLSKRREREREMFYLTTH